MKKTIAFAAAAVLALGMAGAASAHAKLVKSDPPVGGQPSDLKNLALTFNEEISGKLSGADVKDASGAKVVSAAMTDQKNKGLMVMLQAPLKPGAYKVEWHVVASDDGHKTTGVLPFTVK
jgi:methionine-rich copper-binding protein CopC